MLAACGGGGAQGESGEHRLRLAYYTPPENPYIKYGVDEFIKQVEEKTDGRITFDTYPNEQLGKATESLEMLNSGVADLAFYTTTYHPEELPLNQAWALPVGLEARQIADAMWRAVHEDSAFSRETAEAGVIPLMVAASPAAEISSTDTPVPDLASLKGLRVRSSSDIASTALSALGASPVVIAAPELYTALERGTVDGAAYYFSSWKSVSLQEVMGHATVNLGLFPTAGVNLGIGESAWNTLSKEDQDIMSEAGRVASMNVMKKLVRLNEEALEEFKADGLKTYEWSDDELARMNDLLAPVVSDWFSDAEKEGYDAQEAREELEKFAAAAAKNSGGELPSYTN